MVVVRPWAEAWVTFNVDDYKISVDRTADVNRGSTPADQRPVDWW